MIVRPRTLFLRLLSWLVILSGCSSGFLKYDKEEEFRTNADFDKVVTISEDAEGKKIAVPTAASVAAAEEASGAEPAEVPTAVHSDVDKTIEDVKKEIKDQSEKSPALTKKNLKAKTVKTPKLPALPPAKTANTAKLKSVGAGATTTKANKSKAKGSGKNSPPPKPAPVLPAVPAKHEPADVEDPTGFNGRRPIKDPFRVGEEVVHQVNYFKLAAGEMRLRVEPFRFVNGRKSYNLVSEAETGSWFASIYTVKDRVQTFLDYELMVPWVYFLDVKESSHIKSTKTYFDFNRLQANFWEKKYSKKSGHEEKKLQWEILPFSQNVFSALYYLRLFAYEDGKEYSFRVADDEKNLIFKFKVLRREVLDTEIGAMPAIVVKPTITSRGAFKQQGELLIWLSDDDRKFLLRVESDIKIGTVVSEVIRLNPGQP